MTDNISPAELVREFHRTFHLPAAEVPELVSAGLGWQRHKLLVSEVAEVGEALSRGDLPGIAHELGDCVYVIYGTALAYGIGLDDVLAEIHAANMTKLWPDGEPVVVDGKVVKGPRYRKPDVAAVLARQRETHGEQGEGHGFGPWHKLTVTLVKEGTLEPKDGAESLVEVPWYDLTHPAECDRLKYGQRCALDEFGDDRLDWPIEAGEYEISAWWSKSWGALGWEYDGGVQWDRVSAETADA